MNSFPHIIPVEFPPRVQVRTQETLIFQLGDSKCPVVVEAAHKDTSEMYKYVNISPQENNPQEWCTLLYYRSIFNTKTDDRGTLMIAKHLA